MGGKTISGKYWEMSGKKPERAEGTLTAAAGAGREMNFSGNPFRGLRDLSIMGYRIDAAETIKSF